MALCFFLLHPPRAPDGPLPPRYWLRLALPVTGLLLIMLAMLGLAEPGAR
jgi:hypothetical protein